jgi:hypothetical protein
MGDVSSPEDQDHQLALLCQQLPRLRRMHRGPVGAGKRLVIDRAVRAARAGEPIDEHLDALGLGRVEPGGTALGGAAPGHTAEEEELADADPEPPRTTLPTRVADGAPRALPGGHVCPRGVCARRERRAVDEARPVCDIFDQALRFDPES